MANLVLECVLSRGVNSEWGGRDGGGISLYMTEVREVFRKE